MVPTAAEMSPECAEARVPVLLLLLSMLESTVAGTVALVEEAMATSNDGQLQHTVTSAGLLTLLDSSSS